MKIKKNLWGELDHTWHNSVGEVGDGPCWKYSNPLRDLWGVGPRGGNKHAVQILRWLSPTRKPKKRKQKRRQINERQKRKKKRRKQKRRQREKHHHFKLRLLGEEWKWDGLDCRPAFLDALSLSSSSVIYHSVSFCWLLSLNYQVFVSKLPSFGKHRVKRKRGREKHRSQKVVNFWVCIGVPWVCVREKKWRSFLRKRSSSYKD